MFDKCKVFQFLNMRNRYTEKDFYYGKVKRLKVQDLECPYCQTSGQSKVHGKYSRYIVEWVRGNKVCSSLEIIRIRCGNCKKTHALVPSFITPYLSYGILFILRVLIQYYQKRMTVLQICKKYDIAESMLYRWIHRFEGCHNKWLNMLKEINTENRQKNEWKIIQKLENALEFLFCIGWSDTFLGNYRVMFHKSFMSWIT